MTDIYVTPDQWGVYDAVLVDGDLQNDDTLLTAVLVSLFTDKRYDGTEFASPDGDPRGSWQDALNDDPTDEWGSWLWLLERSNATPDVPQRAAQYAEDALAWMLEDGVAGEITASAAYTEDFQLPLSIDITKPDGTKVNYQFQNLWSNTIVVTTTQMQLAS